MLGVNEWLQAYSLSHQNKTNKLLHWLCVPAIVFSIAVFIWVLPVPAFFAELPLPLNWTIVAMVLCLSYYCCLSPKLALGMAVVFALVIVLLVLLEKTGLSLLYSSLCIFVVAWIGQFIGHKIEGKRPAFFQDLQFLMIGPLWILAFIYRKLGISY